MKKILVAILVVSAMAATSCKKDSDTAPAKTLKVNDGPGKSLEKSNVGTWD